MANLYKTTNQNQQPIGSFDDYDSIVDEEFQFLGGVGGTDGNSQSDVSSMHMSELGGASVGMGAPYSTNNSPARSNITPTHIIGDNELDGDGGDGGVGSPLQFLPSHLDAVNNRLLAHSHTSAQSHNILTFKQAFANNKDHIVLSALKKH